MSISRMCMHRFAILAILFSLLVGLVVAANGGAQNNSSLNVGANTTEVSILNVNYAEADQQVKIANNGSANVSLMDWMLMNKENLSYSFPTDFILKAGAFVRVHSMAGKNNSTDLYNSPVQWSKNGDIAILKDATGKTVSKYSYPAISSEATTNAIKSNVTTPKIVVYKANNTETTTTSNVTTSTAKDITKITIVK